MMIVAVKVRVFVVAPLVAMFASCFLAGAAQAVSVTNRDDKEQKIQIVEGDVKKDHVIKPAAVLDGVCLKGCVIRLNDNENDEYELDGTEVGTIEDGYLYYDGPETPTESAPGAAKPAAPATPPPAAAPKAP
jgi:hypothetical protein